MAKNTKKKPNKKHDVALFHEFLVLKGKTRRMDEWLLKLNKFLSEFLITVRKKEHNEEYEPNSLRTFFASFQRHSKRNKVWTLPYEKRPVRANSESALVKAKGSKTERYGQQA